MKRLIWGCGGALEVGLESAWDIVCEWHIAARRPFY